MAVEHKGDKDPWWSYPKTSSWPTAVNEFDQVSKISAHSIKFPVIFL